MLNAHYWVYDVCLFENKIIAFTSILLEGLKNKKQCRLWSSTVTFTPTEYIKRVKSNENDLNSSKDDRFHNTKNHEIYCLLPLKVSKQLILDPIVPRISKYDISEKHFEEAIFRLIFAFKPYLCNLPDASQRNKLTKYPLIHIHKIKVQLRTRLSQIYVLTQSLDKQTDTDHFYSRKKEIAP